jgi:hypothetical protein
MLVAVPLRDQLVVPERRGMRWGELWPERGA